MNEALHCFLKNHETLDCGPHINRYKNNNSYLNEKFMIFFSLAVPFWIQIQNIKQPNLIENNGDLKEKNGHKS